MTIMGQTFRREMLDLIFLNTAIANIGDASGLQPSAAAGSLYVAGHTAYVAPGDNQTTNEAAYTGYARAAVARSGSGWSRTNDVVSNVAVVSLGACTAGSATLMFASIGTASSGTGKVLFRLPIGSKLGPCTAATSDNITIPGLSGLAVDDRITFLAADPAGLPTGITEGTVYWVKSVSGDVITISTTQGGSTLDITAAGDAIAWKVTPLAVSAGITPQFAIGTLAVNG